MAKRKWDLAQAMYLIENTDWTIERIAKEVGTTGPALTRYYIQEYSKEYRSSRKRVCYSRSKLGELNPQFGKFGEDSSVYKGVISDCKGYNLVLKPTWYSGRVRSKHIFEHHYVYCISRNLTEIPDGHHVHHLDGDKTNNSPENLIMLLAGDHTKLHRWLNNFMQNLSNK